MQEILGVWELARGKEHSAGGTRAAYKGFSGSGEEKSLPEPQLPPPPFANSPHPGEDR